MCGKLYATSYIKIHIKIHKVGMTTPHDGVEKMMVEKEMTTPTVVEEQEKTVEITAMTEEEEEEGLTLFAKLTNEHNRKTEEFMVEAQDDAELHNEASKASQERRNEMVPDSAWMTMEFGDKLEGIELEEEEDDEEKEEEPEDEKEEEEREEELEEGHIPKPRPNMFSPPRVVAKAPPGPPIVPFLASSLPTGLFSVSDKEKMTKLKAKLENSKKKVVEAELANKKKQKEFIKLYKQQDKLKAAHAWLKGKYDSAQLEIVQMKEKVKEATDIVEKTLKANQVLSEEIEIRDAITKAENNSTEIKENEIIEIEEQEQEPVLRCPACTYSTFNKQHMKGHMTKHKTEVKSFTCNTCNKKFALEHSMKQHKKTQHGEAPKPLELPVGHSQWAQKKKEEEVNCEKCPSVFQEKAQLSKHI